MTKIHLKKESFMPHMKSLELIEAAAKNISPDNDKLSEWYYDYAAKHRSRLAFDLDIISNHLNQSKSILEFGSTPPVITSSLANLGYEIDGIDINPERFDSTIKCLGLRVHKCDVEKQALPFKDNVFDGIIFNEIFEHLQNLLFVMREVKRVTKPGGLLILSTPNIRSLNGIINFLIRNKAYSCCGDIYNEYLKLESIGHMGHVREYTSNEVVDFLRKIGFDSKEIVYRGQYKDKLKNMVATVLPSLSPFMTIIAEKKAE